MTAGSGSPPLEPYASGAPPRRSGSVNAAAAAAELARSAPARRIGRPDDTPPNVEDGTRNGAGKGTRTAADDDGRRRFVAAAASLASATQLGDVESIAAALRTLVDAHASTAAEGPAAAFEAAFEAATDGDPFASLAADVFAEYNRDLMVDDGECVFL